MSPPVAMKAAVLHQPRLLKLELVPVPQIREDEVLIEMKACGICGTDILAFYGQHPRVTYPRIPGHEFSGVIKEVGKKVGHLKEGMRVTATMEVQCGQCWACRHGHLNHCETKKSIGLSLDGGLSQFMKAPARNVLELPHNISFEEGAVAETLGVGYNAVRLKGQVGAGDIVVIIGAGPVGMDVLAATKASGAYVVISDVLKNRLEIAEKMGADRTVCSAEENLIGTVLELTGGRGADKVFETVGGSVAGTVYQAVEAVRARGTVVIMGTNAENRAEFPVTTFKEKEITLIGSRGIPFDSLERALLILGQKKVDLKPLITHTFPLSEIEEAFRVAEMEKDRAMKIMVNDYR